MEDVESYDAEIKSVYSRCKRCNERERLLSQQVGGEQETKLKSGFPVDSLLVLMRHGLLRLLTCANSNWYMRSYLPTALFQRLFETITQKAEVIRLQL